MSYSQDNGYTATTFEALMDAMRVRVNTNFGTTYTAENFIGTGWYKFFYALIQQIQVNEVKSSEIFTKLQEYIPTTNEAIARPSVTYPGIVDKFLEDDYVVAVQPPSASYAGKLYLAVDLDDGDHASGIITITNYANLVSGTDDSVGVNGTTFTAQTGAVVEGDATFRAATDNATTAASLAAQINAHATVGAAVWAHAVGAIVYIRAIHGGTAGNSIALAYTDNDTNVGATKSGTVLSGGTASATYADEKLDVCTKIKDYVVGGVVSYGTETETIALSNGQNFDFKFFLPRPYEITLKLTLVESANNIVTVPDDEDIREALFANINDRYRMGLAFEPQKYFDTVDAPWAATILLEYSFNAGSSWASTVYASEFRDKFIFDLEDITVVIS